MYFDINVPRSSARHDSNKLELDREEAELTHLVLVQFLDQVTNLQTLVKRFPEDTTNLGNIYETVDNIDRKLIKFLSEEDSNEN